MTFLGFLRSLYRRKPEVLVNTPEKQAAKKHAIATGIGGFHSGRSDISERHDEF